MKLTHSIVLKALQHAYPEQGLVRDYVGEFEHQDGMQCWKNYFDSIAEVKADFELYREATWENERVAMQEAMRTLSRVGLTVPDLYAFWLALAALELKNDSEGDPLDDVRPLTSYLDALGDNDIDDARNNMQHLYQEAEGMLAKHFTDDNVKGAHEANSQAAKQAEQEASAG